MSRIFFFVGLILSLSCVLSAQFPFRFSIFGQKSGANLGQGICISADFDLDGRPDLLVGAPGFTDNQGNILGAVHGVSSADGSILFSLFGQNHQDGFGARVISGFDSDQDGVVDFAVSAPRRDHGVIDVGRVYVFSGATRTLLRHLDGRTFLSFFGSAISLAGDIDGDGVRDFIIGGFGTSMTATNQGEAMVVSGKTLIPIYHHLGAQGGDNMGNGVAGLGDLDGDGFAEYAIASTGVDHDGVVNAGEVEIYSGATGLLLWSRHGLSSYGNFGLDIISVPDLNNDGVDEYLISAPTDSIGGINGGRIELFDGALGQLIWARNADSSLDRFGIKLATGDFDGDGRPEFLVAATGDANGGNGSGSVTLIDEDGSTLFRYDGAAASYLGQNVASLGDLEGDGIDDFAMSSLVSQGININIGSLTLASFVGATVTGPAAGYGLNIAFVPGAALPRQGAVSITGPGNLNGLLLTSLGRSETFLGPVPILIDTNNLLVSDHISTDATGLFQSPIDLGIPSLAGLVVHIQAFMTKGNGLRYSRRLSLLFGS